MLVRGGMSMYFPRRPPSKHLYFDDKINRQHSLKQETNNPPRNEDQCHIYAHDKNDNSPPVFDYRTLSYFVTSTHTHLPRTSPSSPALVAMPKSASITASTPCDDVGSLNSRFDSLMSLWQNPCLLHFAIYNNPHTEKQKSNNDEWRKNSTDPHKMRRERVYTHRRHESPESVGGEDRVNGRAARKSSFVVLSERGADVLARRGNENNV